SKTDFHRSEHQKRKDEICPFSSLADFNPLQLTKSLSFYLFLPTHLSTILLRKHGLISKSTSKRYYQVAIPFMRLFCLVLVSIDYKSL
ncbi:hypothetical protein PNI0427_02073, partial [Streptococcus pneumoniae PNI0427]